MRTNLDFNFSPKLTGHVGLNFIQDNHNDPNNNYVGGGSDQIIRQLNIIAPWIPYKNEDGSYGTVSLKRACQTFLDGIKNPNDRQVMHHILEYHDLLPEEMLGNERI